MDATETLEQGQHQMTMQSFTQVVSFNLANEEYAIEITKIKEIILVEGITSVPQMPDYIEGIINLRGNVIPVLDLRKRFGMKNTALNDDTRIVVSRMSEKIIGLIVDSVSQVMKIPNNDIQPPPDTIAGLAGEYLTGVGKVDERMIMLLDIDKVLSEDEKRDLERSSN